MPETITKAELLTRIQNGYNQFEDLLASLSDQQMTIADVNGPWSVKDNLAHLTAWHTYLLDRLQAVNDHATAVPEFMPGLKTEDEVNEKIYQENRDRPLAAVLAAFRASYQQVVAFVETMSEEQLNSTFPWSESGNLIWPLIGGNSYEHYEEHGDIIRRWRDSLH